MNWFLSVLVLLGLIVLLVDALPMLNVWQSRIHIGRKTGEDWEQSVFKKALAWLNHTPTAKLTDQDRLVLFDMLRGKYKKATIQHWQEAALLLGLSGNAPDNRDVKEAIQKFLSAKFDAHGQWRKTPDDLDAAILAFAILKLHGIDHKKYKPAMDRIYQLLLSLKGKDGTVAYRSYSTDYRFVDTLGFICPFLIEYGKIYGTPEAVELGLRQLMQYWEKGIYPGSRVPAHAFHRRTLLPAGLFGWGRGLAWMAIGLMDSYKNLPEDHPQKGALRQMVNEFAHQLCTLQSENGSWSWNTLDTIARPDSSATAVALYYLCSMEAMNFELDDGRELVIEKALAYLASVTRRDGTIDYSQGDTKAIGVYSMHFDRLPFTQGFALRAIATKKQKKIER